MSTVATAVALAYYNLSKILSFNAVYNFVIGARGLGKTYGFKKKVIKDGITKGHEFIYLRRYKSELKAARDSFFADVSAEFPEQDFRVNGHYAEYSPITLRDQKKREWFRIGYFMCLSTAQTQKSVSFPKVRTILYDEFIIEKGMLHYLPNEAVVFTNFFSTVDRNKDKTRAFFLANSVSIDNPYFVHYRIQPKEGEEFIRKFEGFMIVHLADSTEFAEGVSRTKFGKFIHESDPDYEEYAVGNSFADNHENLLENKPPEADYVYTLETKTGIFSVWRDWGSKKWYVQEKRPKTEIVFTLCADKMGNGKKLLFNNDQQISVLRSAFKSHYVYFDSARTRVALLDIFKR